MSFKMPIFLMSFQHGGLYDISNMSFQRTYNVHFRCKKEILDFKIYPKCRFEFLYLTNVDFIFQNLKKI